MTCVFSSCSGATSEPDFASVCFTPKGITGSVSSMASDSSLVSAFAVRIDSLTDFARTRQSNFASPLLGTSTCPLAGVSRSRPWVSKETCAVLPFKR